jgi:hypothetical protein
MEEPSPQVSLYPEQSPIPMQALLAFYQTLFEHKVAPRWLRRTRTDIVTFCLAMAAIMHCYSGSLGKHRDIFRSKYLNVLDFVLGGEGLNTGHISHTDSNRALFQKASVATRCSPQLCAGALSVLMLWTRHARQHLNRRFIR